MTIRRLTTPAELAMCYPAIEELRPHLSEAEFLQQALRQMTQHGYQLVALFDAEAVVAVAGYRIAEYLAWGRTFYVDDLITRESARSQGHGGRLLDWLLQEARQLDCAQFHLDSGVHRHAAHRLYMSRHLQISSHHFSLPLST